MDTPKINDLLRDAVARHAANQQSLAEQIAQLRAELSTAASDSDEATLRRFAQGLQSLVDRLEGRLDQMASSVLESVSQIAEAQRDSMTKILDQLADTAADQDRILRSSTRALLGRLRTVSTRLDEANELSRHLEEQSAQLDSIVERLAKAPKRIDALIAQGLRRSNTVAQGISEAASETLAEVLNPVREEVGSLVGSVDSPGVKAVLEELVNRVGAIEDSLDRLGVEPAKPKRARTKK